MRIIIMYWSLFRNALIDYQGKPAIVANVPDVTSLKEAEWASKAYQVELERKNRELDDFTSIASHDLKEPLRKVRIFTDLLCTVGEGSVFIVTLPVN